MVQGRTPFPKLELNLHVAACVHWNSAYETAELHERAKARQVYDTAVREGKRASIAEAERADVFTMRVGNIALLMTHPVTSSVATRSFPMTYLARTTLMRSSVSRRTSLMIRV